MPKSKLIWAVYSVIYSLNVSVWSNKPLSKMALLLLSMWIVKFSHIIEHFIEIVELKL